MSSAWGLSWGTAWGDSWGTISTQAPPSRHAGGIGVWDLFRKRVTPTNALKARKKAKSVFQKVIKLRPEAIVQHVQQVYADLLAKDVVEVKEVIKPYTKDTLVNWSAVSRDVGVIRTLVSMDVFVDTFLEEEEVLLLLLAY